MPHGCIPCAYTSVLCCICSGHQHGVYGPSGRPPVNGTVSPYPGLRSERAVFGIDPGLPRANSLATDLVSLSDRAYAELLRYYEASVDFRAYHEEIVGPPAEGALDGSLSTGGAATVAGGSATGTSDRTSQPVYTREEFGVRRVFTVDSSGREYELVTIPFVPANPVVPAVPPSPLMALFAGEAEPKKTLWDHLTDEGD